MLFSCHLLYFCTALSLIIMLSSHYHHHKSKTFSQLTQCPFTGTLLLFTGYRVSQATEIYCGQKLLVTEKTDWSFEQQEKRWSTLKQAFIVPHHTNNRRTVNCFHCHQARPVSGGTENLCQTTKCPNCGTQSACRVQIKSILGT